MTIYDEVRIGLRDYLTNNSAYAPLVKTKASGDTFPYVVFEKIDDREQASDNSRTIVISSVEFEINIYAKEKTVGTKKVADRTIATEIEELVKKYMGEILGFRRTYDRPSPNIDTSIYRITMRYTVRLNEKRKNFI